MNEEELYSHLLDEESFKKSIHTIEKNTNNKCLRLSLETISLCRKNDYGKAKSLLSKIDENSCDSFSKSVFMEAKMLILRYDKASLEEIEEISEQVLSINPKAAHARILKSHVAFNRGEVQSGINQILSVAKDHPNSKWVYLALVYLLASSKEYKYAQKYVGKIEPITRRILYYFLVNVMLPFPYRFLLSFIFITLFLVSNTSNLILFVILMIPLLTIVIYGILKRDALIISGYFGVSVMVLISLLISSVLQIY